MGRVLRRGTDWARDTCGLIGAVFRVVAVACGFLWIIIFAALLFAIGFVIGIYGDEAIEIGEKFIRCSIYPIWRDTIRPLFYSPIQTFYNFFICWWDALQWSAFGIWQEVLIPLAIQCGLLDVGKGALSVFSAAGNEVFIGYVVSGDFLDQPLNLTMTKAAWTEAWDYWQDMVCCMCEDLCLFLRRSGPLPPFFLIPPIAADYVNDPDVLCAVEAAFNSAWSVVQIIWRVIRQVLLFLFGGGATPERPEFREPPDFLCDAGYCLAGALETYFQAVWDDFVPIFDVNWEGWFDWLGALICIAGKVAFTGLRLLIHIDRIVQYNPTGDTFWEDPMKTDIAEVFNLIGYVKLPGYEQNTTNVDDPVFGRVRLVDGVCYIVDYILCDSTPPNICADNGISPSIFGTFTFDFVCCAVRAAVTAVLDAVMGVVEASFFFWDAPESLFVFVDTGVYDILDHLKNDLVAMVDCAASLLGQVPVIGECLQDLVTLTAEVLLCAYAFFWKLIIGILTLVYFLTSPGAPDNYLTHPTRALDDLNAILNLIVGDPDLPPQPRTISNCICFVLNNGLQFPPLPCTGSCIPTNVIPLGAKDAHKRARRKLEWRFPVKSRGWRGWNATLAGLDDPKWAHLPLGPFSLEHNDRLLHKAGWHSDLTQRALERFNRPDSQTPFTLLDWMANATNIPPRGVEKVTTIRLSDGTRMPDCSPGGGLPDCFDVCCSLRTVLDFWVLAVRVVANFIQGLARGYRDSFAYFRDRVFEEDLFMLLDAFIGPIGCACDFVELIIPIPDLDLCAPIRVAAELIKGILETFLNAIFAFALGKDPDTQGSCSDSEDCATGYSCETGTCTSPNYPYFTTGGFLVDINNLIDLSIELAEAFCNIFRAAFFFASFDICCFSERSLIIVLELIRLLLEMIINLVLLAFRDDVTYLRNDDLDDIGFVIQVDVIINSIFGAPGGLCDQGDGGLLLCLCGFFNTIIPTRPCPNLPAGSPDCPPSLDNCPRKGEIDPCCTLKALSFFFRETLRFLVRLLATLWQEVPGDTLVAFLFCDENASFGSPLYSPSCGKLEPAIDAIFEFLSECPCQLFGLLDDVLSGENSSGGCFCGRGDGAGGKLNGGILVEIPGLVKVILVKVLQLLRNIHRPEYWEDPECGSLGADCGWATFFFGPIADQACIALGTLPCFITIIFPLLKPCGVYAETWFGGIARWYFEIIIRVVEFIIGAVKEFSDKCGDNDLPPNQGPIVDVDTNCLITALENILTLPFDILIGDPFLKVTGCNMVLCGSPDPRTFVGNCKSCVDDGDDCACGTLRLPFCGPPEAATAGQSRRVPGIVLGFLRYVACSFYQVSPGLGSIFNAIVIFLSILWQIIDRLIGIMVGFLTFFLTLMGTSSDSDKCVCHGLKVTYFEGFSSNPIEFELGMVQGDGAGQGLCYPRCTSDFGTGPGRVRCRDRCIGGALCYQPTFPKPHCTFLAILESFFELIKSVFGIFNPPPQIPSDPTGIPGSKKRETFPQKVARYHSHANATDGIEVFFAAWTDFDLRDCLVDEKTDHGVGFMTCVCRNIGELLSSELCAYDEETGSLKGNPSISTSEITTALSKVFKGSSPCAELVRRCEHKRWGKIPFTERFEYVNCLAMHIRGLKLHQMVPAFPEDFFHRQDAILALRDNLVVESQKVSQKLFKQRQARQATAFKRESKSVRMKRARASQGRQKLLRENLKKSGMRDYGVIDQVLRLHKLERTLRSDRFRENFNEAWMRVASGDVRLSLWSSSLRLASKTGNLVRFVWQLPYRRMVRDSMKGITVIAGDVDNASVFLMHRGISGVWNKLRTWETPWARAVRRFNERKDDPKTHVGEVMTAVRLSPLYHWWYSPKRDIDNPFNPFVNHVKRVWHRRSVEVGDSPGLVVRFWMFWKTFRHEVSEKMLGWRWTPEKERNWHVLQRPLIHMWSKTVPDRVTPELQERAFLGGNCTAIEQSVDLLFDLATYCIVDYEYNIPLDLAERQQPRTHLRKLTPAWHASDRNVTWGPWLGGKHHARMRPRQIREPPPPRPRISRSGAINTLRNIFNLELLELFFNYIEDNIVGAPEIVQFIADTRAWLANTNTDPAGCPDDVGLLYWATFHFRCRFPENLDCANPCAVGLRVAFPRLLIVALIAIAVGVVIPPLMPVVGVILLGLLVLVLPAYAWHFSIRCVLMTPAFPLGGGFSVPILPVPVAIALPFCLLDDLRDGIDSILNECPLEPLAGCTGNFCVLPSCMYSGSVCVPCPESIDIANCMEVGVYNGFSNFVYFLYWVAPNFCEFVTWTASQFCGPMGCLIPFGLVERTQALLNQFKEASPSQECRQRTCFFGTLLTILLPIVIAVVLLVVIALFLGPVLTWMISTLRFASSMPLPTRFLPGGDEPVQDQVDVLRQDVHQAEVSLSRRTAALLGRRFRRFSARWRSKVKDE